MMVKNQVTTLIRLLQGAKENPAFPVLHMQRAVGEQEGLDKEKL